jgi:hypothetical protein
VASGLGGAAARGGGCQPGSVAWLGGGALAADPGGGGGGGPGGWGLRSACLELLAVLAQAGAAKHGKARRRSLSFVCVLFFTAKRAGLRLPSFPAARLRTRMPLLERKKEGKIAPGGIRSHNPSVKYRVLYFLSYRGVPLLASAACPSLPHAGVLLDRTVPAAGLDLAASRTAAHQLLSGLKPCLLAAGQPGTQVWADAMGCCGGAG